MTSGFRDFGVVLPQNCMEMWHHNHYSIFVDSLHMNYYDHGSWFLRKGISPSYIWAWENMVGIKAICFSCSKNPTSANLHCRFASNPPPYHKDSYKLSIILFLLIPWMVRTAGVVWINLGRLDSTWLSIADHSQFMHCMSFFSSCSRWFKVCTISGLCTHIPWGSPCTTTSKRNRIPQYSMM